MTPDCQLSNRVIRSLSQVPSERPKHYKKYC